MEYEQGLAHYEIGRHLDLGDGNRAAHLEQAREIFRDVKAEDAPRGGAAGRSNRGSL